MKILYQFLLIVAIICMSCSILGSSNTILIVKNQSDQYIDSIIFDINGFKKKLVEIEIKSNKEIEISQNAVPSNNHDVAVFVTVYFRNGKSTNAQYYNDLTGSPGKSITATIDGNLQVILKPHW